MPTRKISHGTYSAKPLKWSPSIASLQTRLPRICQGKFIGVCLRDQRVIGIQYQYKHLGLWVDMLSCILHQFHSMSNNFWKGCFLVEKWQEDFISFSIWAMSMQCRPHRWSNIFCTRIHKEGSMYCIHSCLSSPSSNESLPLAVHNLPEVWFQDFGTEAVWQPYMNKAGSVRCCLILLSILGLTQASVMKETEHLKTQFHGRMEIWRGGA